MPTWMSSARVISKAYQGSHIMPTTQAPYPHNGSIRLSNPLLSRIQEFTRLTLYTSIRPIQLESRLVRQGNMFPVINNPMAVLAGSSRRQVLFCAMNSGTRMELQLQKQYR
ncbi:uncharacterized protein TNCV_1057551 [Trichonephila clavipes]|nr:uncharacterized protein TNCV_1057551 [Trichonephila clavipes]